MNKFTYQDVLQAAKQMLEAGPLPEEWAEHGEWCIWCAIAAAKEALDDQHGTGLDTFSALLDLHAMNIYESDEPLDQARDALKPWKAKDPATLTQADAISILDQAIERAGVEGL